MDKKLYIINYKETKIEDLVMEVESGTFDYGFETEEEAKKSLIDIAQKKVDEYDDEDQEKVTESWNDERDYVCIGFKDETYEYFVYMITIPDVKMFGGV